MGKIKDSEMQVWLGCMLDQSVRQTTTLGRIEQLLRQAVAQDALKATETWRGAADGATGGPRPRSLAEFDPADPAGMTGAGRKFYRRGKTRPPHNGR